MHSPTNCYLVSLAAADCVVLIASVPNEILSYYVIGSQWIWGPIGCAIFVFLQNLGKRRYNSRQIIWLSGETKCESSLPSLVFYF